MRLGDTVTITGKGADETFPRQYLRRKGRIVKFENTDCGARPKDPLIIVQFSDGSKEGFWSEEIEAL